MITMKDIGPTTKFMGAYRLEERILNGKKSFARIPQRKPGDQFRDSKGQTYQCGIAGNWVRQGWKWNRNKNK
jgi:hypothetical protein